MHFAQLLPEMIFQTVEDHGFIPTGSLTPLNSYENRVYEIGIEEKEPIIAKYYRPGRWSKEAIIEEHQFLKALQEAELPVVAPFVMDQIDDIHYAFFPKFRGREQPEIKIGRAHV